jgi:hypothetical protein
VAQRVFGIALGYEDLIDHDQLRHDPVLATLAGKLTARRRDCAPLAGKSTLNRLEHAPLTPSRYHKIGHDAAAIEGLFVVLFLEAHKTPPQEIILDLDATDDPLHGHQEGRFFHGYSYEAPFGQGANDPGRTWSNRRGQGYPRATHIRRGRDDLGPRSRVPAGEARFERMGPLYDEAACSSPIPVRSPSTRSQSPLA